MFYRRVSAFVMLRPETVGVPSVFWKLLSYLLDFLAR
jgi:hypothetical protein